MLTVTSYRIETLESFAIKYHKNICMCVSFSVLFIHSFYSGLGAHAYKKIKQYKPVKKKRKKR